MQYSNRVQRLNKRLRQLGSPFPPLERNIRLMARHHLLECYVSGVQEEEIEESGFKRVERRFTNHDRKELTDLAGKGSGIPSVSLFMKYLKAHFAAELIFQQGNKILENMQQLPQETKKQFHQRVTEFREKIELEVTKRFLELYPEAATWPGFKEESADAIEYFEKGITAASEDGEPTLQAATDKAIGKVKYWEAKKPAKQKKELLRKKRDKNEDGEDYIRMGWLEDRSQADVGLQTELTDIIAQLDSYWDKNFRKDRADNFKKITRYFLKYGQTRSRQIAKDLRISERTVKTYRSETKKAKNKLFQSSS